MLGVWKKLMLFFLREIFVISRPVQAEQQRSMLIGVRTAEEDMLAKLAELDKVLRHER